MPGAYYAALVGKHMRWRFVTSETDLVTRATGLVEFLQGERAVKKLNPCGLHKKIGTFLDLKMFSHICAIQKRFGAAVLATR